jgi:3-oxoacyl-[acyl-carrier protein] reductase
VNLGLDGKAALVGGGSRGLGRATAEVLAAEGMRVAIFARNLERCESVAAEIAAATGADVIALSADAGSAEDCGRVVAEAAERLGRLDLVVPNMAGDSYPADVLAEPDDAWEHEFQLYTMSVIRLSRAAVPHIRAQGGGSIVNISTCGLHQLIPELALSEVVRLATAGFTKMLATQLAPDGVRVNSVLPGWIEGELIDELEREDANARGLTPEQVRYGTADEVARTVAFLASDSVGYITGVNLRVDGGWAMTPTG